MIVSKCILNNLQINGILLSITKFLYIYFKRYVTYEMNLGLHYYTSDKLPAIGTRVQIKQIQSVKFLDDLTGANKHQ